MGYKVYVKVASSDSEPRVDTVSGRTAFNTTILNLEEYLLYNITMRAFNIYGEGNASEPLFCHTQEDGKLGRVTWRKILKHLNLFPFRCECLQWLPYLFE